MKIVLFIFFNYGIIAKSEAPTIKTYGMPVVLMEEGRQLSNINLTRETS